MRDLRFEIVARKRGSVEEVAWGVHRESVARANNCNTTATGSE
jgi:hypothetical protein